MDMLRVEEVSKRYENHTALNKVSLHIPKGSIFGLLGPNGAGKTSLIRIINQITAPDEGTVYLNGTPLQPADISKIGYLPEERGLYAKMKVYEQLLYLAQLKSLHKNEAKKRINYWMKRFDILSWKNKTIEELSKGMAQKVQFISTVIHEPSLLIFDEPFTGFDPINTNIIKEEIKRLRDEGATIIFSTHRMESVEEICDHIALINKAEKLLEGPLREIKNAHRTNKFMAEIKGAAAPSKEIENHTDHSAQYGDVLHLELHWPHEKRNDLIRMLMNMGELLTFKEQIPSLNEIFIQKVQAI